MQRPPSWLVPLILVTAIGLPGCRGDDDRAPAPKDPPSSVDGINEDRDRFVAVCEELKARPADPQALSDLREAAAALTRAFRRTPDRAYRRSPKTPKITPRELLRSLASIARRECGGGEAVAIGKRLQRVARGTAPGGRK